MLVTSSFFTTHRLPTVAWHTVQHIGTPLNTQHTAPPFGTPLSTLVHRSTFWHRWNVQRMYNRFCFSTIAERIQKKLILLLFLRNKKVELKPNVRVDFIKVHRCVPSIFIKFKNKKMLWNEMIVDKMKFAFAKTLQYIFLLFFFVSVISVLPCLSPRQKLHC